MDRSTGGFAGAGFFAPRRGGCAGSRGGGELRLVHHQALAIRLTAAATCSGAAADASAAHCTSDAIAHSAPMPAWSRNSEFR